MHVPAHFSWFVVSLILVRVAMGLAAPNEEDTARSPTSFHPTAAHLFSSIWYRSYILERLTSQQGHHDVADLPFSVKTCNILARIYESISGLSQGLRSVDRVILYAKSLTMPQYRVMSMVYSDRTRLTLNNGGVTFHKKDIVFLDLKPAQGALLNLRSRAAIG